MNYYPKMKSDKKVSQNDITKELETIEEKIFKMLRISHKFCTFPFAPI